MPHAPQLEKFVVVSTQAPLHNAWPLGHWHWLPLQVWPAGQALPHAPQLATSLVRLTQLPLHAVCPPAQLRAQLPLEQTLPLGQLLSQVPQWSTADSKSTQALPHAVRPG